MHRDADEHVIKIKIYNIEKLKQNTTSGPSARWRRGSCREALPSPRLTRLHRSLPFASSHPVVHPDLQRRNHDCRVVRFPPRLAADMDPLYER
ncbi:hypothetical protein F2P81_004212 [Scophthalmus maximus]|nr:hypothetical protein F2P81_004212 [Scophthalmus maximus]